MRKNGWRRTASNALKKARRANLAGMSVVAGIRANCLKWAHRMSAELKKTSKEDFRN